MLFGDTYWAGMWFWVINSSQLGAHSTQFGSNCDTNCAETRCKLKITVFSLPSVRLSLQMAGLQVGRKIYTINEDLLFLRPFAEVETMISQAFCIRRSLRLLVATKAKEWGNTHANTQVFTHTHTHIERTGLTGLLSSRMVKIPDNPDSLSFRLCGSAPPHVHAVRKGEWRSKERT